MIKKMTMHLKKVKKLPKKVKIIDHEERAEGHMHYWLHAQ